MDADLESALAAARAERSALDESLGRLRQESARREAEIAAANVRLAAEGGALRAEIATASASVEKLQRELVPLAGAQRRLRRRHLALRVGLTLLNMLAASLTAIFDPVWSLLLLVTSLGTTNAFAQQADEAERANE